MNNNYTVHGDEMLLQIVQEGYQSVITLDSRYEGELHKYEGDWRVHGVSGLIYLSPRIKRSAPVYLYSIMLGWYDTQKCQVIHLDGDETNYRRDNLSIYPKVVRGYKHSNHQGVYWCTAQKQWVVQTYAGGSMQVLGIFEHLQEAIDCYDKRAPVVRAHSRLTYNLK